LRNGGDADTYGHEWRKFAERLDVNLCYAYLVLSPKPCLPNSIEIDPSVDGGKACVASMNESKSTKPIRDEMMTLQIMEPGKVEWRAASIPLPEAGQILVRIEAISTCPHWDLHVMSGEPMFPGRPLAYPYAPGQPGHEAVGVVAALGSGVAGPPVGTRVAAWRDQGHQRAGCYAQYNIFEAEHLLPVPSSMPAAALASLELAMCVQVSFDQLLHFGAVVGQRMGVSGLGPAGLIAVQMARAYGAAEVIAIDPIVQRRELALELGADVAMTPDELQAISPDPNDAAAMRGPKRLDASVDCTGLAPAVSLLLAATHKAVALFGVLRDPVAFGLGHWGCGVALLGYGGHSREAAQRALKMVVDNRLRLEPLITHQLPLSRYAEGVELLRRRDAIKVAFLPWD
jgi:threonine dehydrogenase-like Zn-dependent dehydrogenase